MIILYLGHNQLFMTLKYSFRNARGDVNYEGVNIYNLFHLLVVNNSRNNYTMR